MNKQDLHELSTFLGELQGETDRGLPLVGAALIDEKLLESLSSFLCAGKSTNSLLMKPNSPLGTFAARADACLSLGLIDEHEYSEITLIRKVRNIFAHSRHGISFSDEQVKGLCASFRSELPPEAQTPVDSRYRFTNAVVCTILRLYFRPQWVATEKRVQKTWVKPDDLRWRSFSSEPPPEGSQYVALGPRVAYIVDQNA